MADKTYKSSLFKRIIDLGLVREAEVDDLVRIWRVGTGDEKAITLQNFVATVDRDLGEGGLTLTEVVQAIEEAVADLPPAVTIGSPPNGLSINPTSQVLSLGLSSASIIGALSSTDWSTFNAKIGGTIASGKVAFGTGVNNIGGGKMTYNDAIAELRIDDLVGNLPKITLRSGGSGGSGNPQIELVRSTIVGLKLEYFPNSDARISNQLDNSGTISFYTRTSGIDSEKWKIKNNGILQSNGAQTIQTSTGNLSLATGGGNGNILLSPNGTGLVASTREILIQAIGSNTLPSTDQLRVNGFGILANRSSLYITNGATNGDVVIGNNGIHNVNRLAVFNTTGLGIGVVATQKLDVDGRIRSRLIDNLGVASTEVLVPSATGVVSKRTLTEFATDLGVVLTTGDQSIAGIKTFTTQVSVTGSFLSLSPSPDNRSKIRLFGTSFEWGIGTQSATTFGRLNDNAVTFNVPNADARGWLWGDSGHTLRSQGSMSLTSNGNLTVANSLRLGYGESDTEDVVNYTAEINGTVNIKSTGSSNLRIENSSGDLRLLHSASGGLELAADPSSGNVFNIYASNFTTRLISVNSNGDLTLHNKDLILGTITGTKIGTATNEKLAFWNKTPITQPLETALANTANSGDANTDALIEALKDVILNTGLARST
jgi:hypothetical protein